MSQISQQNTCVGVFFFIKLQILRLATLFKRDFNTGVLLWNLQNFQEQFFYGVPPASGSLILKKRNSDIRVVEYPGSSPIQKLVLAQFLYEVHSRKHVFLKCKI